MIAIMQILIPWKLGLETLSKMEAKRRIAVLGDMLELGDYSKKIHEDVGCEVTKNNIDILITVRRRIEKHCKYCDTKWNE